MAHDVFISHSHDDRETVEAIRQALEARNIACWIAPRDIQVADRDYAGTISDAVCASRALVLVLSTHSIRSEMVKKEVYVADEQHIRIVPFRIEKVTLNSALKLLLSGMQYQDATTPPLAQHLGRLCDAVANIVRTPCAMQVPSGFHASANAVPELHTNTGWAKNIVHDGTGIEMVFIPAGEFRMGSNSGDDDEKPVHKVVISRPFYLGKFQVTQDEWRNITGTNPSKFKGKKRNPVECLTWNDCQDFLQRISDRASGTVFTLPTEAQWEYACRAGSTTNYSFGDSKSSLTDYAWYRANSGHTTHPVGDKRPNPWGLFDMHGNVWEWCQDWWYAKYRSGEAIDPQGPSSGIARVLRGGAWNGFKSYCRSSFREGYDPDDTFGSGVGLRISMAL
jgi:formylglycine-generating enzyme required for sulfatase activity